MKKTIVLLNVTLFFSCLGHAQDFKEYSLRPNELNASLTPDDISSITDNNGDAMEWRDGSSNEMVEVMMPGNPGYQILVRFKNGLAFNLWGFENELHDRRELDFFMRNDKSYNYLYVLSFMDEALPNIGSVKSENASVMIDQWFISDAKVYVYIKSHQKTQFDFSQPSDSYIVLSYKNGEQKRVLPKLCILKEHTEY